MSMAIAYGMKKRDKMGAREGCYAHGTPDCPTCMADGGFVKEEMESGYEPDIVSRAMKKRQMYSKGGRVANETPITADFEDNEFDDLVKRDDLDFHYTGANSGDELGDSQEDDDRRDIVSRVMKARRLKGRMPSPA